ncbi:MAG: FecR family protein [Candidatus Omnitrophica bacterium]|nr:FecR family protein [Candidatus Omnitrophota bacterium]
MKSRTAKLLTAGVFILTAASLAFAVTASAEVIGRVSAAEGNVDLLSPGRTEAVPVKGGEDVSAGDILRTKSISKAELTFSDKSVVTLSEKTRLEIKDYRVGLDGKRIAAVLNIERGKIRAVVSKAPGKDNFLINTPNASGSIKGTDVVVAYQKSATSATVLNGSLSFSSSAAPEKKVEIKSGESSVILADSGPTSPRTILAMERTAHEKDTLIAKAPAGESAAAEGYSEPGEMKAVIVKLSGSVKVKNGGSAVWHDAKVNETLRGGDTIETNKNGKVEFRVENGDVITLQQDSNFTITRLKETGSGEHESLFESKKGKLRAKVEKLKGNSKFEVKTPTAVASVRGTILFLNILPNLTSAYFEDGNGVLKSMISGIIQNVAAGTSSGADGNGNVSNPIHVTDEQRSQWNQGWDVEGGAEGYSAPEGYSEGTGGGTGDNPDTNWNQNPFSDKIFTDNTGVGGGTTGGEGGGSATLPVYLSGRIEGAFGPDEGLEGPNSIEIDLSNTTALAVPWSGIFSTNAAGSYENPGYSLWHGEVYGTSTDGGAFTGWAGGSWHSWEGVVSSIYIDPSGLAGNLFGYFSGTNSVSLAGAGTLSGTGDLYTIPMAQLEPGKEYGWEDGTGNGWLNAYFGNGSGQFDVVFDEDIKTIAGENWGIWRDVYNGGYSNSHNLNNWLGAAGGYYGDAGGRFFVSLEGVDDGSGAVRIDILRTYLDYDKLGTYYGTILGNIEGEGFEGIGLGGFREEPLTSSGDFDICLYTYNYGDYFHDGDFRGLFGTTGDLWGAGSFNVTSIGYVEPDVNPEYGEGYEGEFYEPFIWFENMGSDNPRDETRPYTTYDGGAFFGFTAGDGQDAKLLGLARLLYIDPAGNAGVMSGDLKGAYSTDIGMYLLQGEMTKTQMVSAGELGIPAEELPIWNTEGYGYLSGTLTTGGYIYGQDDFRTLSIVDHERGIAQNWGVYGQTITGWFENDDPGSETTWSGVMGGDDPFGAYYFKYGDGEGEGYLNDDYGYWMADLTGTWDEVSDYIEDVDAELHGKFITYTKMGNIDGKILGIYEGEGEGDWLGVGAGVWNGGRLTLSGLWGYEVRSLYYDNYGYIDKAGEEWGLIGSTVEQWWNEASFPVLAMGKFYNYAEENPLLWNTPIESYNAELDNSTTLDGGAFKGFSAGIWKDGSMSDGSMWAIYAANGAVGLLHGDINGRYNDEIEMWQAEGALYRQAMGGTVVSPEDLFERFAEDGYHAEYMVGGSFDGINLVYGSASESSYYIANNPWGLFNITLAGEWGEPWYEGNAKEGAVVLGYYDGDEPYYNYYELVTISNSSVSGNKIVGDVFGTAIDLERNVMSTIFGDARGIYNDREGYSTFALSAIGGWVEKPLVTGGMMIDGYFGDYDMLDYGYVNGVLGSTGVLWDNSPEFTILGNYDNPDINEDGAGYYNLWGSDFVAVTNGNSVLYGSVGGTTLNNSLKGMLAAIYVRNAGDLDADGDDDYLAGYVLSSDGTGNPAYVNGAFYPSISMFDAYGNMTAYPGQQTDISPELFLMDVMNDDIDVVFEYGDLDAVINGNVSGFVSGEHIQLRDQNWGLWRASAGGAYASLPTGAWNSVLAGEGDRIYGRSPWVAVISGSEWTDNGFLATMNGVTLYGTRLGEISGNIAGVYNDTDGWEALAIGRYEQIIDLKEEHIITNEIDVAGSGWGNINGVLMAGLFGGEAVTNLGIPEGMPDTGTYSGMLAGTGNIEENSNWRLALGIKSYDDGVVDGYLLGTASSNGFHGVSFGMHTEGEDTLWVGMVDGTISDITNVDTTWNAKVEGDWVDLAEIATSALGFDQVALADMVQVPITETYTALLTDVSGNANLIAGSIDLSVYDTGIFVGYGQLIRSALPVIGEIDTISNLSDYLNHTYTNITETTYTADILGQINGSTATGQAAGSITYDGTSYILDEVVAGVLTP